MYHAVLRTILICEYATCRKAQSSKVMRNGDELIHIFLLQVYKCISPMKVETPVHQYIYLGVTEPHIKVENQRHFIAIILYPQFDWKLYCIFPCIIRHDR